MVIMTWVKVMLTLFSYYIGIVLVWVDPLMTEVFTYYIRIEIMDDDIIH